MLNRKIVEHKLQLLNVIEDDIINNTKHDDFLSAEELQKINQDEFYSCYLKRIFRAT